MVAGQLAIRREGQNAAPGWKCGRTRSSARPCSDISDGVRQRPAEPRRGQAERRRRRHDNHLGRASMRRSDQRTDAVVKGIAGGQHADLAAAMRQHLVGGTVERARPRPRRAANERRRKAEVALAAEHDFGRADQGTGDRGQALDTVLADADDGQPAARCGISGSTASGASGSGMTRILILGGTTEARLLAGRLAGRPDLEVTLSLAGRTSSPLHSRYRCASAASAAPTGSQVSRGERIDALVDATHPYAAVISANAVDGRARSDVESARPAPTAMDCGPGRPMDRGPRCSGSSAALGRTPRRVFVALGRKEIGSRSRARRSIFI